MLNEHVVSFLGELQYRADAKRCMSIVPLGGIYWEDEVPDFPALLKLPRRDRDEILRLFRIRFKIWEGDTLSGEDENFWQSARSQLPSYPLFRRTVLSAEEREDQDHAESETKEFFTFLADHSDEFAISTNDSGTSTWSATIRLKEKPFERVAAWWKRMCSWR